VTEPPNQGISKTPEATTSGVFHYLTARQASPSLHPRQGAPQLDQRATFNLPNPLFGNAKAISERLKRHRFSASRRSRTMRNSRSERIASASLSQRAR
jgi:hypothetical protein